MSEFINNLILNIGITDVIDICLLAFIFYKVIGLIRQTRAQQLVKGILIVFVFFVLSDLFNLYAINWILTETMTVGIISFIVLFQPEIRRVLEVVGRGNLVKPRFMTIDSEKANHLIAEFIAAIEFFASKKTGALIVIERQTQLTDIMETGVVINGKISDEFIKNIFYEGAPLHDGAIIVRNDRIYAAGCVLPLSNNKFLNKELGTRHRAAIGITEVSDALSLIVSEETGMISIAEEGKISRNITLKDLEKRLHDLYVILPEDNNIKNIIKSKIARKENVK